MNESQLAFTIGFGFGVWLCILLVAFYITVIKGRYKSEVSDDRD